MSSDTAFGFADEMRVGLRGMVRRVWGRRGVKVHQRVQMVYKWMYLFLVVDVRRGRLLWSWIDSMRSAAIAAAVGGDYAELPRLALRNGPAAGDCMGTAFGFHYWREMCGRYSLIADLGELARRFEFDGDWDAFERRYNIAPSRDVLTVVGGETRRAGFMRWGLIPWWAKNASIGSKMINARAETVPEKPTFRDALIRRRCLVLADGFYEWQRVAKCKRPIRIVLRSGEPFRLRRAVVGMEGPGPQPHPVVHHHHKHGQRTARAHPRPYARHPTQGDGRVLAGWGHPRPRPADAPALPYDTEPMETYEVSFLINSAANDSPEVIARVV